MSNPSYTVICMTTHQSELSEVSVSEVVLDSMENVKFNYTSKNIVISVVLLWTPEMDDDSFIQDDDGTNSMPHWLSEHLFDSSGRLDRRAWPPSDVKV